jgi:hypothetical protein
MGGSRRKANAENVNFYYLFQAMLAPEGAS